MPSAEIIAAAANGTGYFTTIAKMTQRPENGGAEIRVSLLDVPVTFAAEVYDPAPFVASTMQNKAEVEADNGAVQHLLNEVLSRASLIGGLWGGARLEVSIIDYRNPGWGALRTYKGKLGESRQAGLEAETQVRGLIDLLNQSTGDRTANRCRYVLGEARCGVDVADFTFQGEVVTVTNRQRFEVTLTAPGMNGLRGRYHLGLDFDFAFLAERIDPTVDFDFGGTSPISGLPPDHYSIRWDGTVTPTATDDWTFYVSHDDGARLYIDDMVTPVIDEWGTIGDHTYTLHLAAGVPVAIKLEYNNVLGDSYVSLRWSKPAMTIEVIPTERLVPAADGAMAVDYFAQGKLTWLTGANAGLSMEVLSNDATDLVLFLPAFADVAIGDTFEVIAGDPKTLAACHSKFHNAINFGGEPDQPTRESVFKIPE